MKKFIKNAPWFWKFHQDFFKATMDWNARTSHEFLIDGVAVVIFGERAIVIDSKDDPPAYAWRHEYQTIGYSEYMVGDKFKFTCYFGTSAKSLGFVDNRFIYSNLTLIGNTSKDEVEHIFMVARLSL